MTPPEYDDHHGTWDEFRLLVLSELRRTSQAVEKLERRLGQLEETHAKVKGAAALFGAVAGAAGAVAMSLISGLSGG